MIRVFKKFKDLLDVADWNASAGKYWRTKADGSGLEAVPVDSLAGVGIESITKTGTVGLVDTYTVTLTDASSYTFDVSNGTVGADGDSAYQSAVDAGFVGDVTAWLVSLKGEDGLDSTVPGPQGVGISSITGPVTVGLEDTYTINFSDNSTPVTFTVTNGQNGSTPVVTFQGTTIYVDGVAGPDLKGAPGTNGISVTGVSIDVNKHLIISLSEGAPVDAGLLPVNPDMPSSTDQLSEGSTNKYFTDQRALLAAPAETTTSLKSLLEASTADTNPLGTDYVYGGRAVGTIKTTWDSILLWLNTKYEALRTYSGGVIGTGVSLSTAISELDEALQTVEYPVTSIAAGSWVVESGTVSDLDSLTDSGMVFIEPAGVANSFVEVWLDGVVYLTNMHAHYRYYSTTGTTNHSPTWKMFNTTLAGGSGDWEDTGVPVATNTSLIDVFNKVIENGDDYITDKPGVRRVKFRFDHPQAGSGNHRLLLKHVVASKGPVGVATSISHNALGGRDLVDQHPTSAITGLDTALADKAPKDSPTFTGDVDFTGATVTGLPGALSAPYDNGTKDADFDVSPTNGYCQYVTIGNNATTGITMSIDQPADLTKSFTLDLRVVRASGNQRIVTLLAGDANIISSGGLMSSGDILPSSGASATDWFQFKFDATLDKYIPVNALYDVKAS